MRIVPLIRSKQKRFGVLRKAYAFRKRIYDEALSTLLERIARIKANTERSSKLRIAYLSGRVKSIHSIIRKAIKSKIPSEKVLSTIEDIVGIRIVVNNLSDIEPLIAQLRKIDGLTLKRKKKHAESKGYRALHAKGKLSWTASDEKKHSALVEIQIRTLLQDAWAILSHRDIYKNNSDLPKLAKTISRTMSGMLSSLDGMANDFRRQIATEVQPPNDLSDGASLDREGIAFLYFEILGEIPNEYKVRSLSEIAAKYQVDSVGEARKGLTKDVFSKLQKIYAKRFAGLEIDNFDLFEYGLSYVQNGKSAFQDYRNKIEEEWAEIETYGRREALSEMPETFDEFIEMLKSGDVSMEALKALGGVDTCALCANEILMPELAAVMVLDYYDNPDTDIDLASVITDTAINDGHEVESIDSSGLCSYCSYQAAKDD
jgi:putative GTP pyrophosphokinase